MAKGKTAIDENAKTDLVIDELRKANRLLAILATRGMEQKQAIALLHGLSFSPRAIAEALSMTRNAVSVAVHRIKKSETQGDSSEQKARASSEQTGGSPGNG